MEYYDSFTNIKKLNINQLCELTNEAQLITEFSRTYKVKNKRELVLDLYFALKKKLKRGIPSCGELVKIKQKIDNFISLGVDYIEPNHN